MKPNFFIIGAPKCGTTALAEYLRAHPQVYFSNPKEPYFFCNDIMPRDRPEKEYLELFADAQLAHKAIGEGSVYYLYSKTAVENILNFNPDAKFVVMLRNPLDLIYSLYSQFVFNGTENADSFEKAWMWQDDRLKGKKLPSKNKDLALTQYRDIGKLGEQLNRAIQSIPNDNLMIIFFEDFKNNTALIYSRVLSFLELMSDNRNSFRRVNANKNLYSAKAQRLIDNVSKSQYTKIVVKRLKRIFAIDAFNFSSSLKRLNLKNIADRQPLSPQFLSTLSEYFCDDIKLLESITGRDLSCWVSTQSR